MEMMTEENLTTERNRDFMEACRRVVSGSGRRLLSVREIASEANRRPARSYYVSYDYIGRVLRQGIGAGRSEGQRARVEEIRGRVETLRARGYRFSDALSLVLAGGSPNGFFLSDDAAVRLYYKLRSRRRVRRPLSGGNEKGEPANE